jgi:hypothetical protein
MPQFGSSKKLLLSDCWYNKALLATGVPISKCILLLLTITIISTFQKQLGFS